MGKINILAKSKKIRVFYSWQSDLPKTTNLNAIRKAIKKASDKIESSQMDLKIIQDEATRDTSGSPHIASTILDKISKSDIFIADITTITNDVATRACPNPNVLFELGYAVAQLGWDRIILLFNQSFGNFPKDIPFDFVQHRISTYSLDENEDVDKKTYSTI